MEHLLFTFEDQETGDLRSTIAANEAAARLQLGGIWTDVERTAAWTPCNIDGLPALQQEAQKKEREAYDAMIAANPMGKTAVTTPEALAAFTAAQERHQKAKARCSELAGLAGR